MAFHHRKLLDESISDIIATFCKQNCDEPEKFNGTCPSTCFNTCPPNSCKLSIIPIPPLPLLPPPPPPPPPVSTHNKSPGLSLPLTASLAVLATAFFIFTCYTIYKFYTVWRNSRRRPPPRREAEEDDDENDDEDVVDHPIWHIRTIGLQPSVINAITVVKYKSADGLVDGTDCAVCLSEFEEDETLRLLPKCSHAFHIPCIDTWLASHTNCPMCRAGIPAGPFPLQEPAAHGSGRAEEVAGSAAEIGAEMDENVQGDDSKIDVDGLQAVRRSVSMDSLSASMISAAVASAFPRQSDKAKVEDRMSSSMKRSASCSAKVFLSRHSSRR